MTRACPACGRAFRSKKPKAEETSLEQHERIMAKARAGIAAALRKPMPRQTVYK
jgi:hypothetical protein